VEESAPRRFWAILLAGAVAARIVAILLFGNLRSPYLYEYGAIARNLLAGHGYAMYYPSLELLRHLGMYSFTIPPPPTAFTLPGIVTVYYAVLALFGETRIGYGMLYGANLAASVAGLIGLYLLARQLWDERTGRWSALIASCYPVFIFAVTTFGGTVYYHAVMAAGLCILYTAARRRDMASAALAGVMTVIWIYFRPEVFFFSFLFAGFLGRRAAPSRAALYLAIVVLGLAPWTMRNYYAFDALVFQTTNSWLNLWRGNNPATSGGSFDVEGGNNWLESGLMEEMKRVPQNNRMEVEISHIYQREAFRFIRENPGRAIALFAKKYLMFWSWDFSDPRARNPVYLGSYGILLLTFIAGFASLRQSAPRLILILIGAYSLVVAVLHVETRYQTYVSILYIPFAAAWCAGRAGRKATP
jgi:hypothetical protein